MYISMMENCNNLKLKHPLNRKDKSTGKEFRRWDVTLDPDIVKELGWKEGTELKAKVSGKKLIIERE